MVAELKNETLAARLDGLAQIYATANPEIAETMKKAAADARSGKPRKTVMRETRKLQGKVNDPHSTVHRAIDAICGHFGA